MKNSKKNKATTFEKAFEIIINSARSLGTEHISVENNGVLNRILAEDIISDTDIPPLNKSTRDGFACRLADLSNELTIIETAPAGIPPEKAIGPNECTRIMTGAVVPKEADCVIMFENTKSIGNNKVIFTAESTDNNIRPKGQDAKKGDILIRKGCRINPPRIAVLTSSGYTRPLVTLQPKVGIIATGTELVEPSCEPLPHQTRSSNAFQLTAQLTNIGVLAENYGIVNDTENETNRIFEKAISENDVVISTGGVSAGDFDFVRKTLEKNNIKVMFEKIATEPGRPMVFGLSDNVFCFGLPGTPVSAFIMFELLVKPFLFKMMGHSYKPVITRLELNETIKRKKAKRDSWLPIVSTENGKAASIEYHGSSHIHALCQADGLLHISAGVSEITKGTIVEIRLI